ncbi:MAG: PaaI family thioesterase [Pseudomonadota bacterium]|nr:PaaI family thioesterase [Pseudomonadota bacterium]
MPLRRDFTLEAVNRRGDGFLPGLVGFRVIAFDEGRLDAELDIVPRLLAPNGYLHAATIIALADTACGYGCLAHLPDEATNFTTVELKTNFLGTARERTIACTARAVHLGRTTQVWDAAVMRTDDQRTIALFRCTQMILYPGR